MRPPEFWSREEMSWGAAALLPFAMIYASVAARRFRRRPEWRAAIPVICVGNPTVGGAGKTPLALLVAARLAAMGRRPVFLSRGYGGAVRKPTVVDPDCHGAEEVGDEPLILADHAPAVVSPDRVAGAMRAQREGDVIVMDDGFQNPALAKDLSLLVVDTAFGLGNGLPLPSGPLRLPLGEQLARAQGLVLIGGGDKAEIVERAAVAFGLAVMRAELAPAADVAARLLGQRVIAFAGIGRPAKFFATLERIGARIVEACPFDDHHLYSAQEAEALLEASRRRDAVLVTTEKDMMRLESGAGPVARLAAEAVMLPVTAVPDAASAETLDRLIGAALLSFSPRQ